MYHQPDFYKQNQLERTKTANEITEMNLKAKQEPIGNLDVLKEAAKSRYANSSVQVSGFGVRLGGFRKSKSSAILKSKTLKLQELVNKQNKEEKEAISKK